ncbi:DUF3862 domain-containing protein [Rheinheimera sp. 4Y26]|uniref:DUF3862 domain-containing protein n=1 Tax=Rheinheimera sp. 4Y26 TaxID=2977811 RepID=UPI0021B0C5BF|nr:DUF3862 domain-containing protein [Rheinheimera sp. 4Y26]MCT6699699.1 DUF3862 domain-containing protein [Rheinheimera sp. 4Y26]
MKKIITAALLLTLVACSKLSMDNYQQLKTGMSYNEVTAIIGEPESCEEALGTRTCLWGDDKKQIKAAFLAEKAMLFSHKGLN